MNKFDYKVFGKDSLHKKKPCRLVELKQMQKQQKHRSQKSELSHKITGKIALQQEMNHIAQNTRC